MYQPSRTVSAKRCGCPRGYPLIDSRVRHTGRCPFADETLTAYPSPEGLAKAHVHEFETVQRCKTCGAEEALT